MEALLSSYAEDLNDDYMGHEFTIWPRSQLLKWFNEGLCFIAGQRPELFTKKKIIQVDACSTYVDTCSCLKIRRVYGQSTKDGRILRPLNRKNKSSNVWSGGRQSTGRTNAVLRSYELDESTGTLQVFPPISPGQDVYILIECAVSPDTFDLDSDPDSIPCNLIAALRHWVLYNAKMMDAEHSSSMMTAAQEHRSMFIQMLGIYETAYDDFVDEDNRNQRRGR